MKRPGQTPAPTQNLPKRITFTMDEERGEITANCGEKCTYPNCGCVVEMKRFDK